MGWTAPKTGVQERQGKGRDGMGKEMTETESDAGKETHDNTERASEVVKAIALALKRNIRTPSFVCSSRMTCTVP